MLWWGSPMRLFDSVRSWFDGTMSEVKSDALKTCRRCGYGSPPIVLVCPQCSEVLPDLPIRFEDPSCEMDRSASSSGKVIAHVKTCRTCGKLSPAHVLVCSHCTSVLPALLEGQGVELPAVIDARDCLPELVAPMLEAEPLPAVLFNVAKAVGLLLAMFILSLLLKH